MQPGIQPMQSLLTFETAQVRVCWLAASASVWVQNGKNHAYPEQTFGAKIYLLKSATRCKHFLMQIEAEEQEKKKQQ